MFKRRVAKNTKHSDGSPRVPHFYSDQKLSLLGTEGRQKFIDRLYNDGSHTGSLDRAEKSQSSDAWNGRKGQSGETDSAHMSGEGMYIRSSDDATSGISGGVILFSDDVISKLDAQWAFDDVWGNPHNTDQVAKWNVGGGPWGSYIDGLQTDGSGNEIYIPHQVPWTDSVVDLGKVPGDRLGKLEVMVADQNIDISVLNSKHIVVQTDPSSSDVRFVVWDQPEGGGPLKMTFGPPIKRSALPSAKIQGKLDKYKTADPNAPVLFGSGVKKPAPLPLLDIDEDDMM